MKIQELLTKKANNHYDVKVSGLVVTFKKKQFKTAWVKYEYPAKSQLLKSLFDMAKGNYPKQPEYKS